jgi:tight adherence protein C
MLGFAALVFASTTLMVTLIWQNVRRRTLRQRLRQVSSSDQPSQSDAQGWIESVARTTGRLSKYSISDDAEAASALKLKFIRAGWRNRSVPMAFFGVKTVLVFVCPLLVLVVCFMMPERPSNMMVLLLSLVGAMVGLYAPDMALNAAIQSRRRQLLAEFPDALDLLTVCIEAGLSLEAALVRVAQEMEVSHPLLSRELNLVVLEMRSGRPRDEALRNLARRNDLDAIESFVATLTQAEKFGGSVSDAIRVYSETLRTQRRQGAEEQAAKIGTKLTLPLVLCILPVLFMVMAGPAMLALVEVFSSGFGGQR